jgi:hypothetical protein
MKNKYAASILSLLLLASVFTFGLTIHRASADGTTLSIPSVSKSPSDLGSTFTVPVQISNVNDLFGFDINITWDNTLITFLSLNNASLSTIWPQGWFDPLTPSPQTGAGYVRYAAVAEGKPGFTGSGTLFNLTFTIIKACNFPLSTPIHFDGVKLSDSSANSIPVTLNDGQYSMSATVPDIDFTLVNPNPSKPYEYCKYVEVQVYATHICAHLTDYDLTIDYDSGLLKFVDVDAWGVFGTGQVDNSTAGIVRVYCAPSGTPQVGESLLLFTLTFHVEFDDSIGHIWRTASSPNQLTAHISLDTTTGDLSFQEGTIPIGQVTPPTALTLTINLIQGDVTCDGRVSIDDLRTVAYYYDQSGPAKYDIKTDGTIDIYDLVEIATNFGYYNPDTKP